MERRELFEKTKTAFADLQTRNKRCQYPAHLKKDAITLLEHYPVSSLCKNLGITEDRLKRWMDTNSQRYASIPNFMEVTLSDDVPISAPIDHETVTLTLNLPHQCSLSFSHQPVKSVTSLVCAILRELVPCSI